MDFKILLLSAILAVVSASRSDRCSSGESYWCSDLRVAKECGAIKHCMSTIWKNTQLEKENNEVCQFCETIVQDAKDYVSKKQSQQQIQDLLDSACSVIPDKSLATQCRDLVNNYLPEVLAVLEAELDPQVVCSIMGLCSGFKDKVVHPQIARHPALPTLKVKGKVGGDICVDCKALMQDIKDQFTSQATEKQIEDLIEQQICAQLGTLEDECKQLVESYIPEIFDMLASELDPSMLCQALGLCNQTSSMSKTLFARMRLQKTPLFTVLQQTSAAECDVCKTVLAELQTLEREKATQQEIENFIKTNICARLGSIESLCDETVDTYGPELFEILASELDPNTVCAALGFCSAGSIQNTIRRGTLLQKPVTHLKASAQCIVCEFIMKELDGMLQSNATQAEIIAALEKVCSILPDTIKAQCDDFVKTYGPAVIALLEQELSPQVICTTLGLCKASTGSQTRPRVVPVPKVGGAEMCGVCETVMQYVDSLLEQNSTITEIEQVMEKVCNFLPKNIEQECDNIVETYGAAIIQLFAQYADPKEVCTAIGLCNQNSKEMPAQKIVPVKSHLLGAKECTYGPAYWCASRENAEKCKAVDHCKNHVWKN